jgi:hypothetical protein
MELSALWQMPRKTADRNLSDDLPSRDWNGTDTGRFFSQHRLDDCRRNKAYVALVLSPIARSCQ